MEYESTPSPPALGASGTRGGGPGPPTARALRKRTAQKVVYSGYGSDELEDGYYVIRLLYFFLMMLRAFLSNLVAIGRILMFLLDAGQVESVNWQSR